MAPDLSADVHALASSLALSGAHRAVAEAALAGRAPSREQALAVLRAPDDQLADVLWAAFAVRERHFGRRVKLAMLNNARSGLCPEDCGYCSQSAVATSDIPRYRLKSVPELVAGARAAREAGAVRYCMVTSARGPSARDVAQVAAAARAIRAELPELELCVSLGLMGDDATTALADAGIDYVNHNLNTSRRHYPAICSTHTFDDRVATIQSAKRAGMRLCSGVIIGMGETDDDLVDVATSLGDLQVESLPVNFLLPIAGTPLAAHTQPDAGRALRALALFRLTNPRAEIRAAGGREKSLGEAQGLALFAANSIFVDGYLTTPGQAHADARDMVTALGFEVDEAPDVVGACAS